MPKGMDTKKILEEITSHSPMEEMIQIFGIDANKVALKRLSLKVKSKIQDIEKLYHDYIFTKADAQQAYIDSGRAEELRTLVKKWVGGMFDYPNQEWFESRAGLGVIHFNAGIAPALYVFGLSSLRRAIEDLLYPQEKKISDYEEIEAMRSVMDLERFMNVHSYDICRFGAAQSRTEKYQEVTRILAHDIANPLAISINRCTLALLEYKKNQDVDGIFKNIDLVKSNPNLIGDLLKSAKSFIIDDFNIQSTSLWRSVTNNFFRLARDLGETKDIEVDIIDSVPEDTKLAINSIFLIFEVLLNIVNNAIKFSERGSKVQIKSVFKDDVLIIEVIDHGSGMSREQKEQLFVSNESTSGTEGEAGTGLGMGIAYRTMKASGGSIEVMDNTDGSQGTTFVVKVQVVQ